MQAKSIPKDLGNKTSDSLIVEIRKARHILQHFMNGKKLTQDHLNKLISFSEDLDNFNASIKLFTILEHKVKSEQDIKKLRKILGFQNQISEKFSIRFNNFNENTKTKYIDIQGTIQIKQNKTKWSFENFITNRKFKYIKKYILDSYRDLLEGEGYSILNVDLDVYPSKDD